jgi:hypothetical protein
MGISLYSRITDSTLYLSPFSIYFNGIFDPSSLFASFLVVACKASVAFKLNGSICIDCVGRKGYCFLDLVAFGALMACFAYSSFAK